MIQGTRPELIETCAELQQLSPDVRFSQLLATSDSSSRTRPTSRSGMSRTIASSE